MDIRSIYLYLRLGVGMLVACSWNQLVGQLTPYYVHTFICSPNEDENSLCWDQFTTSNGSAYSNGNGYCNEYRGSSPPLDVYAIVSAVNCESSYTLIADTYPTPQPGDPYSYAVSSGAYTSACSPDGYSQVACDSQYNYSRNGCTKSPC